MIIRDHKDDIAYFLSFCIELYKNSHLLTGEAAFDYLDKSGALKFLENNFESIHTQGPQWILEEIEEFLSEYQQK